jgi:hypothetical protein
MRQPREHSTHNYLFIPVRIVAEQTKWCKYPEHGDYSSNDLFTVIVCEKTELRKLATERPQSYQRLRIVISVILEWQNGSKKLINQMQVGGEVQNNAIGH